MLLPSEIFFVSLYRAPMHQHVAAAGWAIYIMAIVRSLAIGKSTRSAGQLTFRTVRGRTIVSQKRGPDATSRVVSSAEQQVRGNFKAALMLSTVLAPLFDFTSANTQLGTPRNRMTAILRRNMALGNKIAEYVTGDIELGGKTQVRELFKQVGGGDLPTADFTDAMEKLFKYTRAGYGVAAPIVDSVTVVDNEDTHTISAKLAITARVGDVIEGCGVSIAAGGDLSFVFPSNVPGSRVVLTAAMITAGTVDIVVKLPAGEFQMVGLSAYSTPSAKTSTPNWHVVAGGGAENPMG